MTVTLTPADKASGEDGCGATRHQSRRKRVGELRRSAAVLLVAKEDEERLWFTSAGQRPTATMVAMEREREH